MKGFLLINKPTGITSYDVIRKIKKCCPPKTKIGHAGTLDPFAEGLLIVAIGREFTKQLGTFLNVDKTYEAELTFGVETDSYDIDGKVTKTYPEPCIINRKELETTIALFKGDIKQQPPIFSAKKINGTPAYKHAREGKTVELSEISITIYDIIISSVHNNKATITVHCSKGTYIRSLAYDIGKAVKFGAHLSALNRLAIGNVHLDDAISINDLSENSINDSLVTKLHND
tara:strand:+ start:190 stop:879 length:690 start_codon:yes stop_codon:yes gene_type:complete